jgi:hypothetical protein
VTLNPKPSATDTLVLQRGGAQEEDIDLATVMQFLEDTQEVSGEAELSFSDVLPAMLNAGFSEKQCAAIMREILRYAHH